METRTSVVDLRTLGDVFPVDEHAERELNNVLGGENAPEKLMELLARGEIYLVVR